MNELVTRTIFGLLYAAAVIAAVYFHPYGLLALLVLIYVVGLNELKHLFDANDAKPLFLTASLIGTFALLAHVAFASEMQNHLMAFLVLIFMGVFIHHVFMGGSEKDYSRLVKVSFSVAYLFIPAGLAISVAYLGGDWEPRYLLAMFLIIWATDTSAYLTGKSFGKHKLIERLSPKKSIEGLIGGVLGALLMGYILAQFWTILSPISWMIYAVLIAASSTIGDLFQSALKRAAGVKDSGNLIPGHGGILDRLDSFLFSVPIVYFYLLFFT